MKKEEIVYVSRTEFNEALHIMNEMIKLIYLVMETQVSFLKEFIKLLEEE